MSGRRRKLPSTSARTLLERMGFRDPDLLTPEHDALMHWLHDHIGDAIAQVVPLSHARINCGDPVPREMREHLPPPRREIGCPIWEPVIAREDRYVVGFADMAVDVRQSSPLVVDGSWRMDWFERRVYFEVKTKIRSIGECIRQLQVYRHFAPARYVLVSPDSHLRDLLESQGFGFVEAPAVAPVKRQGTLPFGA